MALIRAANVVLLTFAQVVENHSVAIVLQTSNVTVGVNLVVKVALQGIKNVNTMGAKG